MPAKEVQFVAAAVEHDSDEEYDLTVEEEEALDQIKQRKHDLFREIDNLRRELGEVEGKIEETEKYIREHKDDIERQQQQQTSELLSTSSETSLVSNNTDKPSPLLTSDSRTSLQISASLSPEEKERQEGLRMGRKKFNVNPNKGIEFLVEKGLIQHTKESIVQFLLQTEYLDKTQIGEYLGEGKPFNIEVMKHYVEQLDFTGLSFDGALRRFLNGFRLPGEAQKIDRLMESFAMRYCNNNPGVFASSDTAYVLAFSIIMLNTDLHNPAIKNKITKAGFIKNNRGINDGKDLPEKLLSEIYDTILNNEIKMEDDNEKGYTFTNPEREGYLTKQGGRVKTWKKRWFILTGNCLYYFKDPNDVNPCGIIPLENLEVREVDGTKIRFELYSKLSKDSKATIKAAKTNADGKIIEGRHNSYLFAAETEEEKMDWIHSINANMAKPPIYTLLQAKREKVTQKHSS